MDSILEQDKDISDTDILENWTILNTEEAYEATSLDEVESEGQNLLAEPFDGGVISSGPCVSASNNADSLPALEEADSKPRTKAEEDAQAQISHPGNAKEEAAVISRGVHSDSDDGVSVITDSEPEELCLPENQAAGVAPAHYLARRASQHSNDYFDQSDPSAAQEELPLELDQSKDRKYVHLPNTKVSILLNVLLILCATAVLGLGVGHFLGLQEECPVSQAAELHSHREIIGHETAALLHKLEDENELLKYQLKQLQQGLRTRGQHHINHSPGQIHVKQGWKIVPDNEAGLLQWDIPQVMADPDHRTEAADVVQAARQELADNLGKVSSDSSPGKKSQLLLGLEEVPADKSLNPIDFPEVENDKSSGAVSPPGESESTEGTNEAVSKLQKPSMTKHFKEEKLEYPYSDEDLEAIQTRYAKTAQTEHKPAADRKIHTDHGKNNSKGRISFFSKMEDELNGVLDRIVDYSSNLVENSNMKDHVSSSINTLSNTLEDMKVKIRSISEKTAAHSSHAIEKVKKSVYKMVQNVKYTSERVLKSKPEDGTLSSKMMLGFNHLKNGLVNKWCHLKGKMSRSLGGQERDTTEQCLSSPGHKPHQSSYLTSVKQDEVVGDKTMNPLKSKQGSERHHQKQKHVDQKPFPRNGKYNKTKISYKYQDQDLEHPLPKGKSTPIKSSENYHGNSRRNKKARSNKQKREKWNGDERKGFVKANKHGKCLGGEHCNRTDGKWMERLAEGRATQRNSERESEWMFDRARARQEWRGHGKQSRAEGWSPRRKDRRDNMFQEYSSSWVPSKDV